MVLIAAKVGAIALGVLAFMADAALFYPYFAVGALWGVYNQLQQTEPLFEPRVKQIGSPGYIEQLTGAHLPPLVCMGINLSAIACHIDHHPSVFIPATGLALGSWAGHKCVDLGRSLSTYATGEGPAE